jgi:hypothetical protein
LITEARADNNVTTFICTIEGQEKQIPLTELFYLESLEYYVKLITRLKPLIVGYRKEAKKTPKSFLRIYSSKTAGRAAQNRQGVQTACRGTVVAFKVKKGRFYRF